LPAKALSGQLRLAGYFMRWAESVGLVGRSKNVGNAQQKSRPQTSRKTRLGDGFNAASQNPSRLPLYIALEQRS
jgi:hypothetical protein